MEDTSIENPRQRPKYDHFIENIAVVNNDLSFNDFFEQYLIKNQPCIIKNVDEEWKATKHWVNDSRTDINFRYLRRKYGNCTVLTYDCNKKFYNSHKTEKIQFGKYLEYWTEFRASQYSEKYPLLYLKDWHLRNSHPLDHFYDVPSQFSSDWLNEYLLATGKDDYRFVYMGPKGTWTPFHSDVFKSYSWSVNIVGKKRWIFLPPGEEERLKDRLGNLPHQLFDQLPECRHYIVIQNPGDAIFVPSGWYHQVTNLEDTISINHNWVNGCNIKLMYQDMQKHLDEVKEEIADCKGEPDFHLQCQKVLNASYGMDYRGFLNLLSWIAQMRMKAGGTPLTNISQFDLKMVKDVMEEILLYEDVKKLHLYYPARQLLCQIEDSLKNF